MNEKNIVIIGMPGAGKTSVAEAVAKKLGRKLIDIDTEIVKAHGDIPKIFEREGEAAFRAYAMSSSPPAAAAFWIPKTPKPSRAPAPSTGSLAP